MALCPVHRSPPRALTAVFEVLLREDHCGAFWRLSLACKRWRLHLVGSPRLLRTTVECLVGCGVAEVEGAWGGSDWRACLRAVVADALWSAVAAPSGVVLGGAESPLRPYKRCAPGRRGLWQRGRLCDAAHGACDGALRGIDARAALESVEVLPSFGPSRPPTTDQKKGAARSPPQALVRKDQSCHETLLFPPLVRVVAWQRVWDWTVDIDADPRSCWHCKVGVLLKTATGVLDVHVFCPPRAPRPGRRYRAPGPSPPRELAGKRGLPALATVLSWDAARFPRFGLNSTLDGVVGARRPQAARRGGGGRGDRPTELQKPVFRTFYFEISKSKYSD